MQLALQGFDEIDAHVGAFLWFDPNSSKKQLSALRKHEMRPGDGLVGLRGCMKRGISKSGLMHTSAND